MPGYLEQCRQLTGVRAEYGWLRAGSQMVQQQALRDLAQAMGNFFAGTHGKPSWRKAGRNEGFRIVALKPEQVRRLSRKTGEVWIPKAGWVARSPAQSPASAQAQPSQAEAGAGKAGVEPPRTAEAGHCPADSP